MNGNTSRSTNDQWSQRMRTPSDIVRYGHLRNLMTRVGIAMVLLLGSGLGVWALVTDLDLIGEVHQPAFEHITQAELNDLVAQGRMSEAFQTAFDVGDRLFETSFNALDGGGANVGDGQRFTRVPRADLDGPGQWATHRPPRVTGPNAQSCNACHNQPAFDDGAGTIASNNVRDPFHTGNVRSFITRQAPHLFGIGAKQRLAEEMTEELQAIRDQAITEAMTGGISVTKRLVAKGVEFGFITARPDGSVDTSAVEGVDADLVIRPIEWKGITASVRAFVRGAAHNELGMQGVEMAGPDVDGDGDGVVNELTIGDITALAVYQAAQPRPTTKLELAQLGLIPPIPPEDIAAVNRGAEVFDAIGCSACHVPRLVIENPIFSEPSQNPNYRDAVFPSGQDPLSAGVDPALAITFDLTRDQPDNRIEREDGTIVRLGSFETDERGRAIVRLFSDLKRHDMGPGLAEPIDEVGTGASVFMTTPLWGVGSTAPYLHDGRATTLTEAILEHGGEAARARGHFMTLSTEDKKALVAFLSNLVLFKLPEE